MKPYFKYIFFTGIITFAVACGNKSTTHEDAATADTDTTHMSVVPVMATSQFKVWGNCEQCKETIENSLKVDGIARADWDVDTKRMSVTYDETKISLEQIQKNVAAAGYDNASYKGDDKAYANLPECCQYERK